MHQTNPTLPRYGTDLLQVGVLTFETSKPNAWHGDIHCLIRTHGFHGFGFA